MYVCYQLFLNALCMYAISYCGMVSHVGGVYPSLCLLLIVSVPMRHCVSLCYGRRVGRCSRLSVTGVHGSSAGSRRVASLLIVSCVVTSCVDSKVHCCRVCQVDAMAGDRRLACSWCIHDLLGILLIRMSCLAASMS
jgi:hypothetical protein